MKPVRRESKPPYLLAIDQGTTSSRAILFDGQGHIVAQAQQALATMFPREGWIEQDPEEIWRSVCAVGRRVLRDAGLETGQSLAGIGISNQRETTIVWERASGAPVGNAIVWQDRRTAERCAALARAGCEPEVNRRAGLLLDPYFSATKLGWLLDHHGLRSRAEDGLLAFGTVDSFLLWRLTDGARHATDATNAARTSLFDIRTGAWDDTLLDLFDVPRAVLPAVGDTVGAFGTAHERAFGVRAPVLALIGDQQAAAVGQGCLAPGAIKSTYGTGCFVLANTGSAPLASRNRLLTTIAYQDRGARHYALEGAIFAAGTTVQWLRDGLGVIKDAAESEGLARGLSDNGGVYLVPAFAGLGAPHWDPEARGAIVGLTRGSGAATIVRAALEAVAYQTHDLLRAMTADGLAPPTALRVDGGMAANAWAMQFLADILGLRINRPAITETTALGAAGLAAYGAGLLGSLEAITGWWRQAGHHDPAMDEGTRAALLAGWREAVARVRSAADRPQQVDAEISPLEK